MRKKIFNDKDLKDHALFKILSTVVLTKTSKISLIFKQYKLYSTC